MVSRKGLGKGAKGYKNILGNDSSIHSQSAKGIKQPNRMNEAKLNSMDREMNNFKEVVDVSLYLKGTGLRAVEINEDKFRLTGRNNDNYDTYDLQTAKKSDFKLIKDRFKKLELELNKEEKKFEISLNKNLKNKQVIIKGKRWFEKTNGNTYHSTEVFIDGEFVGREPFSYGYGDQYETTGFEILQEKGIIPKLSKSLKEKNKGSNIPYYSFRDFTRENRKNFNFFVDDVSRKKDL